LSFQPTSAKNTNNAIVHATHVNVRIGPSIEAPVVGRIVKKGTPIEIISKNNNWYYIHYDILKKGWILADFVTPLFQPEEVEPEYIDKVIQAEKMQYKSISGRAYFDLGVFAFEEGNYQNAITNFEKAIQLNPDDPEFYHYMGKTYLENQNYELSEKYLSEAFNRNPLLSDIKKDRAILLYRQEKYRLSADLFLEIIRENPSEIISIYYAANCLYKMQDYYQAGQLFQKSAKASPSLKANCMYYAGICYTKTGLPHKGRQLFMQVQNNPKSGTLKEYASKWLNAIDKKTLTRKPYFLFAQLGYQYDSNIRLEPIDEDLYTDEDDYCTSFLFSGNYTLADAKPYQISAGMVYFKYVYSEYTQYNMDGSMAHLNTKIDLLPVKIGLDLSPSVFWLDSKKYMERFNVTPSFSYNLLPELTVIVSFSNKYDNHLENDDRNAVQTENELTLQYAMPKKHLILFSTFRHTIMNADNDIHDNDRIISRAGIRMHEMWGFTTELNGQYEQKKYDLLDPAYDAIRDDYKYMATLNIQRSIITPWLGIKTELKYTKNSSNINIYNYKRSSVTFSLTTRY
jgi:tetratricopeptide (TPR) repeat protein